MKIAKLESIYSKLPNGYEVSRKEIAREKELGNYDGTVGLGYGEIDMLAFQQFVLNIPLPASEDKLEFCDFGSGTGKAVLVAASTGLFKLSTGIELMQPLHDVAEQAMKEADGEELGEVKLLCDDMFAHEQVWQSAHVIFITCTLFTDEMMARVSEYVDKYVRTGAIVMCTTRKLTGRGLNLIKEERIKYAKGSLMCFVYRRHRRGVVAEAGEKQPSKRVKV